MAGKMAWKQYLITFLGPILILLFGCNWEEPPVEYEFNYDNAKEAATSAWEMQIGWVSDQCLKHLDTVEVIETLGIENDCGSEADGCMFTNSEGKPTNVILVDGLESKRARLEIAVHEYIHHIETCEYPPEYYQDNPNVKYSGRKEGHYNKAIWGDQEDSVENLGKRIVRDLSYL